MADWLLGAIFFVFGSVVGSFLNVCAYRVPLGESVVWPGSRCPSCGTQLRAWDLIPLLSQVLQGSRCRYCGKRFSWQYFVGELMSALLFLFAFLQFGAQGHWGDAACATVAGAALIIIFFIDLRHYIIPDELVWIVFAVGVVWDVLRLSGNPDWGWITFREPIGMIAPVYLPRSLVGAAVGGGVFLAVAWFFGRVFGKESLGGGDVKLAAAMGAVLGPGYAFLVWFLIAVFAGAVIGVLMWIIRARRRGEYIPFGPFLAASGIVMMLWGREVTTAFVAHFYTSVLG
jgi:leader peptidase (prepilin peptidase)/N-methyltransferase